MDRELWNERYDRPDLVYGEAPNDFLVAAAATYLPASGTALDLAAGEGRNALFLAERGLETTAVDQSAVGMGKTAERATARGLRVRTDVADLATFTVEPESFDVITSIFLHLPTALRRDLSARIVQWLRPGGVFVLEAYAPDQLGRGTGGPSDPALLAPLEVLVDDFSALEIVHQHAEVRDVTEGVFHSGAASVVQIVARKA